MKNANKFLIESVLKRDRAGVEDALLFGADIHYKNDLALSLAIANNDAKTVRLLTENEADANADSVEGILGLAASNGNCKIMKILLNNGANPDGDDAMVNAIRNKRARAIKLLAKAGADIHKNSEVPMFAAITSGNMQALRFFINCGANVHARNDDALCVAADIGNLRAVKFLYNAGCEGSAYRALYYAARGKHTEIVRFFNSKGYVLQKQDAKAIA